MNNKIFIALILLAFAICGCSSVDSEISKDRILKNRLDEIIIENATNDDIVYQGIVNENDTRYFGEDDKEYIRMINEIDEKTALEIGDAVIRANFDKDLLEETKKYDVYELDGKKTFIVKRYNEQKSLYVAIDKTNCEIINIWQNE